MSDSNMLVDARARHDFGLIAASLAASLAIHGAVVGLVVSLAASFTAAPARIDAVLLAARVVPAEAEPVADALPESTVADPPAPPRDVRGAERTQKPARVLKSTAPLPERRPVPPVSASEPAPTVAEPAAEKRAPLAVGAMSASLSSAKSGDRKANAVARSITPPRYQADYLANPPPAYPRRARRDGIEGTVTLKVLVTAAGTPGRVEVETSSGSRVLDRAALDAVKAWRFVPARRGDEAVDAWVRVPVAFRLESG